MVNTFLPYPDFKQTAECLDAKRLAKERVESYQIINVLLNPHAKGWSNHPVVNMWKGYVPALKLYCNIMIEEWVELGYNNTMKLYDLDDERIAMPWWLGNEQFHKSHQASLVRKNKEFYGDMFPDLTEEDKTKGYVWPHIKDGIKIIENSPVSVFSQKTR